MKPIQTDGKQTINTGKGTITFKKGVISVNGFTKEVTHFEVSESTIPTLILYWDRNEYVGAIEFSSDELLSTAVNELTTDKKMIPYPYD